MIYNIGRGGSGTKVISDIESEALWGKIKVLHDKANKLMNQQSILQRDIERKHKEFAKKKPSTKIYQNIKNRISKMEEKNRIFSTEITTVLREKDLLLKKVKKKN